MLHTILITCLSIMLIFVGYLLYIALRRITQYENYLIQFQQVIEFSTERMKAVDSSGHYEADDETSFFFDQLKELQLLLNEIFEDEQVGTTTEK